MANAGTTVERRRVPDNSCGYIEIKTKGKVTVVQHDKAGYDPEAPTSDSANSKDYRRQEREERQRRREREAKRRA